jgi:hypothetical protein
MRQHRKLRTTVEANVRQGVLELQCRVERMNEYILYIVGLWHRNSCIDALLPQQW